MRITNSTAALTRSVITMIMTLCAAHAQALSISASAEIDWANVHFEFLSGAGNINGEATSQSADIYNQQFDSLDSDYSFQQDWTMPGSAEANIDDGTTQLTVHAEGSADLLRGTTMLSLPASGGTFGEINAYAQVWRTAIVDATADGILQITVPYTVSASIDEASNFSASGDVYLQAYRFGNGFSSSYNSQASAYTDFLGVGPMSSDSGVLLLSVAIEAGQQFSIYAQASTNTYASSAPVPIPPAVLMLSPALLMLLRRNGGSKL